MDITVQIIAVGATHVIDDIAERSARYRRGDVVDVYLRSDVTEPPAAESRLGFIHVLNVPDTLSFSRIRERLTSKIIGTSDNDFQRIRKWRIRARDLSPQRRADFLANKEITVGWLGFKSALKRKVVIVRFDPSLDDETNSLIDTDVT